jgi:transposase
MSAIFLMPFCAIGLPILVWRTPRFG